MQIPKALFSAGVSRAGARTGLQLLGHGDMQRFNSSSLAFTFVNVLPPPVKNKSLGHVMVSSTSSGVQQHSLSEGKLETKSSEESREGCNLKPIRFAS